MENTENENVISLFAPRDDAKKKPTISKEATPTEASEDGTFEEIALRNMANQERLKRERLNANKSVLRSYRIKS